MKADHAFCDETVEWWRAEVAWFERQNDLLWLVICVGLPVAIVVGTVLGALTWGSQ